MKEETFRYYIDEWTCFEGRALVRGWAFHRVSPIIQIGYAWPSGGAIWKTWQGLRSEDVQAAFGKVGSHARFKFDVDVHGEANLLSLRLGFRLENGEEIWIDDPSMETVRRGPYAEDGVLAEFRKAMEAVGPGCRVLEIGSRARSGVRNRDALVPEGMAFTGLDILDGDGVDVVGDAHELSRHFRKNTFDFIYSLNVFEHLLMPWKVAVEMNRVMKPGGQVLVLSHQSFPLHDIPCDFWRFSDRAWHGLFNVYTGFEVVRTALYDRVRVLPHVMYAGTRDTQYASAFIHSMVWARKTGKTRLGWKVPVNRVLAEIYPE
ncbi:methyltransferase domain-containing protein [Desulfatirhabdium butyrativorans]|uniref:methyltransferase domain-containing protein n=1 Tax=Desulfatirhabdium butyrativorans TaxID=340467 RepID=UPI000407F790|nr:methyltransferase domain-containing protein [Desulfatirhabdium butyrativorans]